MKAASRIMDSCTIGLVSSVDCIADTERYWRSECHVESWGGSRAIATHLYAIQRGADDNFALQFSPTADKATSSAAPNLRKAIILDKDEGLDMHPDSGLPNGGWY